MISILFRFPDSDWESFMDMMFRPHYLIEGEAMWGNYMNYFRRNIYYLPHMLIVCFSLYYTFGISFGELHAIIHVLIHFCVNQFSINPTILRIQTSASAILFIIFCIFIKFRGYQMIYSAKLEYYRFTIKHF